MVWGQSSPRTQITGRIVEESTGEPLHFVNVFLANTTMGAATDEKGIYKIYNVPAGTYDLIVNMVGYESEVQTIRVVHQKEIRLDYHLKLKTFKAPELKVTAPYPHEWQKQLEKFKQAFFGSSRNAKQCTILNPEVLDFKYNARDSILVGSASRLLEIENRALGYRISYDLWEFQVHESGEWHYHGYAKFAPLHPDNDKKASEWRDRRLEAYQGSLRHFLLALLTKQVKQNGFRMNRLVRLPTRGYFFNRPAPVVPDELINPGSHQGEYILNFNNALEVVYTKDDIPDHYPGYDVNNRFQRSWLTLDYIEPAVFTAKGILSKPKSVMRHGYWSWERFADELPIDYSPLAPSQQTIVLSIEDNSVSKIDFDIRTKTVDLHPDTVMDKRFLLNQARSLARQGDSETASSLLNQGLEQLDSGPLADSLFLEVKPIMTEQEMKDYSQTNHKGQFFIAFWKSIDPTPATVKNERFTEHYQRLAYAQRWYTVGYDSMQWDDRGLIYIRYGEPSEIAREPTGRGIKPNECWVYRRENGEFIYDFYQKRMNYELMDNLFELRPKLTAQTKAIDKKAGAKDSDRDIGMPKQFTSTKLGEFLELRSMIADDYTDLYMRAQIENIDVIYISAQRLQRAITARQTNRPPVESTWERPEKPLQAAVAFARFYDKDTPELEIYYGTKFDQFNIAPDSTGQRFADLNIACSVMDESYQTIFQDTYPRRVRLPDEASLDESIYIDQVNIPITPGKYHIALEISSPNDNRVKDESITLDIHPFEKSLHLSDIEWAYSVEPVGMKSKNPNFIKKRLLVTPYPSRVMSRSEPLTVYFEIYGLTLDETGHTQYEIDYELKSDRRSFFSRINPFGKKQSLSTSFVQSGVHPISQEYFSLDLKQVKTGNYTLQIKVKDLVINRSETVETLIEIVE